ncbi:hypothetical protein D3C83_154990 [compost metagenome]
MPAHCRIEADAEILHDHFDRIACGAQRNLDFRGAAVLHGILQSFLQHTMEADGAFP